MQTITQSTTTKMNSDEDGVGSSSSFYYDRSLTQSDGPFPKNKLFCIASFYPKQRHCIRHPVHHQAKVHLSLTIITEACLFCNGVYVSAEAHCWQCALGEKLTWPNRLTRPGMMLDGGEGGDHTGIDRVEIYQILAMQDTYFIETESFEAI